MIDEKRRDEDRTGVGVTGSADGGAAGIAALAGRVRGRAYFPEDERYAREREGFQTAAKHKPDVLIAAEGAEDVRAAVGFAASRGLPVAVQGTGHALLSVASEGGVLVTTSGMDGVRVDPDARTARIGAGVRWERVIEEAVPYGLAPLSGSAPFVNAVSYTLGGGLGLLSRLYGYAADHVRSMDVVGADGRLRRVTAGSDPDLFWALRGGRDNFGVVTAMEMELFPVAKLYGGGLFFDAALAQDVFEAYLRWTASVPEAMGSSIALIPFPDLPGVPEAFRGRHVVHVRIFYAGEAPDGERLVVPLREVGPRLAETLEEMPYAAAGSIHNEPDRPHAYTAENAMLRDLDASAVRDLLALAGPDAPLPCVVQLRHLGGALARPPEVPNAVGHRDAKYLLNVLSPLDGFGVGAVRSVHGRVFDALAPWTVGRCLNYMYGEKPSPEQVRSAYEPGDYRRLRDLKALYDPANTFRSNHNVPPATRQFVPKG